VFTFDEFFHGFNVGLEILVEGHFVDLSISGTYTYDKMILGISNLWAILVLEIGFGCVASYRMVWVIGALAL
jgi:hypothetical protein